MAKPLTHLLDPEKALIFRITHRDNVPWLLHNGLHCSNSERLDPNFVEIGNPELIERRRHRAVPISPGETLGDYIPFYFTPYSPMLYNIQTGYAGVPRRDGSKIVILVSSLRTVTEARIPFVFSDRHAYLKMARFANDLADLDLIDWELLRNRDFQRNPERPESFERYQAEALIHRHLPAENLVGLACYNRTVEREIRSVVSDLDLQMHIAIRKDWYFS